MKAVQVVEYGAPLAVLDVAEPALSDPEDVLVRVAGAGVCRTDLHIQQGWLAAAFGARLPYTLGHENSGWVAAVGPAVEHLAVGDPVIVHPAVTCGHCAGCRAGRDMHCRSWRFPGVDGWPGGYAEMLRTTARSVLPLPAGTDPTSLAPLADAGLTAMHATRRLVPHLTAGTTVVVLGAGGVGQLAVQLLRELTPARVLVREPDPDRANTALRLGAHGRLDSNDPLAEVREQTGGRGADAVLDLVGEQDVPALAMSLLAKGGVYSIVGYGGRVELELLDMINREITVLGNQIGTYTELGELMSLVAAGRVTLAVEQFPLSEAVDVLAAAAAGRLGGRAVLVP